MEQTRNVQSELNLPFRGIDSPLSHTVLCIWLNVSISAAVGANGSIRAMHVHQMFRQNILDWNERLIFCDMLKLRQTSFRLVSGHERLALREGSSASKTSAVRGR
jgi:hypothetical protein